MERVILFEIGSFAVKACEIELTRKPRPPLWLAHRTLPEGAHADPGVSGKVLRDLIKEVGTKTRRARAILSDPDLVVRSLDVPAQSEKEISVALGFAMTELLPLPLEELVVDYEGTLGRGGIRADVVMAGAPRIVLERLWEAAKVASLRLDRIEVGSLCAARAGAALSNEGEGFYLVEVGARSSTIEVVEDGHPQLVRSLPTGGESVTSDLSVQLGIAVDQAEGLKRRVAYAAEESVPDQLAAAKDVVNRQVSLVVEEVARSIDYFSIQRGLSEISRLLLVGGSAPLLTLKQTLAERTGLSVEQPGPRRVLRLIDCDQLVPEGGGNWIEIVGAVLREWDRRAAKKKGGVHFANLLPAEVGARNRVRHQVGVAAGTLVLAAGLLGVPTALLVQSERSAAAAEQQAASEEAVVATQVSSLSRYAQLASSVSQRSTMVTETLSGSVPWPQVLTQIAGVAPGDSWITQFSAQAPSLATTATTATAAGGGSAGTGSPLTFSMQGCSQFAPVNWLNSVGKLGFISNLWVSTSNLQSPGQGCSQPAPGQAGLTAFTGTAQLEQAFGSYRADTYLKAIGVTRP